MGSRQTKQQLADRHQREIEELMAVHEHVLAALRKTAEAVAEAHAKELANEKQQTSIEQQTRIAAQRGLTPYVYAIQALNRWLRDRPELCAQLQPVMQELGLWGVEVGYDPNKDRALSIIWAKRV